MYRDRIVFLFERDCNIANHKKRGMVTHEIQCLSLEDNSTKGVLAVSYLCGHCANTLLADPYNYKKTFSSFNPPHTELTHSSKTSHIVEQIKYLKTYLNEQHTIRSWLFSDKELKLLSKEELLSRYEFLYDLLNKRYRKEWKEFRHLRVNKPTIDIIKYDDHNVLMELMNLMTEYLKGQGMALFLPLNNDITIEKEMRHEGRISFDTRSLIKDRNNEWISRAYITSVLNHLN